MNIVLANYMISKGRERSWATVNVIGLALAIIANLLLIPRFGVIGSAVSISLCEALMFVMRSYVCRDFLKGIRELVDPIRIFLCALFSGVVTQCVLALGNAAAWNAFAWLLGGGVVFGIVYGASLAVCHEQFLMSMIQPVINRFKPQE